MIMLKQILLYGLVLFGVTPGISQATSTLVNNPDFDRTIRQYLDFTIPTISCAELSDIKDQVVLLDARERNEYRVSHIDGARHLGYKKFNEQALNDLDKDQPIVVYCSIGYRSEKMGEKLEKLGFTNVTNLYGSIFEWVNQGFDVVDDSGEPTKKLHTYNRSWSRWVEEGKADKEW